jgi:hypothetical protein
LCGVHSPSFGFGDEMIDITKAIGAVAATVAALGGSYTLADKFGWFDRAIIEWSPENFKIVAEAGKNKEAGRLFC